MYSEDESEFPSLHYISILDLLENILECSVGFLTDEIVIHYACELVRPPVQYHGVQGVVADNSFIDATHSIAGFDVKQTDARTFNYA